MTKKSPEPIPDSPTADPEFDPLTIDQRGYIHRLQNPYASLSVAVRPAPPYSIASNHVWASGLSASKSEFESECRRIFRQYIPILENGRLRDHYKAFIARNASRSPTIRHGILAQMRTYDLSGIRGFEARFNREKDPLTEEKLQQIEDKVLGKK
jgi:hypothetical protein